MRKETFCLILVSLLLLASPALAEIHAELETPDLGQVVSGKAVISGWAYSDLNPSAAVTVTLRVNGVDTSDTIPYGTSRLDVQTAHPGAPLNTGFGRLQNYGLFSKDLTSVGVNITIQGEPQPLVIDHQVTLIKPGARSSDADPTLFSFLEQLSPVEARTAVDGEEVIIAPGTVIDSGTGGTRKSTLRLLWTSNTQTFGIVAAASGTSFDGVQTIFNNKCATAQCHDHTTAVGELDLSVGRAYRRTVAFRSGLDPEERLRVNPGKSSESYLYQKIIEGGGNITGDRMPPACPGTPSACLSPDEIQTIANWINEGAPPPQPQ